MQSRTPSRRFILLLAFALASIAGPSLAADPAPEAAKAGDTPAVLEEKSEQDRLVDEAKTLLEKLEGLQAEYNELRRQGARADEGGARAVAALQARRRLFDWMRSVEQLAKNLIAQQAAGLGETRFLQDTRKRIWQLDRRIPPFLDELFRENAALRAAATEATPERLPDITSQLQGSEESIDETVRFVLTHVNYLEALGLGSKRIRKAVRDRLTARAGELAARLEIAAARLAEKESSQTETTTSGAETETRARNAEEELDRLAASLWTTCEVMEALDIETAEYRRTLFLATGEFTTDVLDTDVVQSISVELLGQGQRWLERRGPVILARVALFLAIVVGFWIAGRVVQRLVLRFVGSRGSQLSQLARDMIVHTSSRVVFLFGVLLALSQVGVNVTALLAGLGIIGFIIGFALQETLGNFASGTMILLYQPFDVGDVIEAAGVMGKVDHMNLVSTAILTFDNQMLVVPNSRIWGNVIRNATAMDKRRVDLTFPLALDVDVEAATRVLEKMCRDHPAVLDEPAAKVEVQSITAAGVVVVVYPWVKTDDYWSTFWTLNREAHSRLKDAGFRIATTRYEIAEPTAPNEDEPSDEEPEPS